MESFLRSCLDNLTSPYERLTSVQGRDVIVPAFPGTLLLSQWIATKAIPGKTGTDHIPVNAKQFGDIGPNVECCGLMHTIALSRHKCTISGGALCA